jgi:hypothetical protein
MANELTLSVNGAKQVVSAAPETPLLFVLRNELKLTGPRPGVTVLPSSETRRVPATQPLAKEWPRR